MIEEAFIKINKYLQNSDFELNNDILKINNRKINKHKITCNDIIYSFALNSDKNIVGFICDTFDEPIINTNINTNDSNYFIAYKSLDGLTNAYSNITCGSIYGIYKFDGKNIGEIVEAGYCIYGLKTYLVKTVENNLKMFYLDNYTNNFIFMKNIVFDCTKQSIYSVNKYDFEPEIIHLLRYYTSKNYDQRWTGTMVADCHRILMNNGVFMYFPTNRYKKGKLSLMYQVLPFSYIFEKAGGTSVNSNYIDLMTINRNITIYDNLHQKTSVILCSKKELRILKENITNYEIYKF